MEAALNEAGTIGIFGIFAILLVREVLLYAGKHPTQNGVERALHTVPAQCPVVEEMGHKVDELHRLHTAADEDGVPILPRLARNSKAQTKVLEEIRDNLKHVRACPMADQDPPPRPAR